MIEMRASAAMLISTALAAILLVGGCGRSERSREPRRTESANAAAPAKPSSSNQSAAEDAGDEADTGEERETASAAGESRGRQARCEFNDEPARACTFTQVLGDGSFDVETSDRTVRILVDGQEAAAFEVFGPDRRVPLPGAFHRDRSDPACWVADDNELPLYRVCAR